MAYFYTYIDPAEIEARFKQNTELEPDGEEEKEEKESKAIKMETNNAMINQDDEIKMAKL